MTEFTDKHLSAFIDGELAEDLCVELDEALKVDQQLADRLDSLRSANEAFVSTQGDMRDADLPKSFLDVLDRAERSEARSASIVAFPKSVARARTWLQPLAACLILAIGTIVAYQIGAGGPNRTETIVYAGAVSDTSPLYRVLESVPSGETFDGIKPILTYATENRGYCREVDTPTTRSLACRDASGDWTVLAVVQQASNPESSGFRPASAAGQVIFDTMADELMVGVPLTLEDEARVLSRK